MGNRMRIRAAAAALAAVTAYAGPVISWVPPYSVAECKAKVTREVADRLIFMADGQVLERATPQDFFERPQHERARKFVADIRHA